MKPLLILLFVAFLSTCVRAQSEPGFVLESEEDGVKVYVREETNGDMTVRALTRARAQVPGVQAVLDNAPAYPEWVHRCDAAYVVAGGKANNYVFVSGIDMPFPFRDKEVVARVQQRTEADGQYTRTITAEPAAIPPTQGRDRQINYQGEWRVTPLSATQVEVQVTVRTDAGSGLPTWLRKEIMTGGPSKTIANLRRRLEQAR